MGERGVKGAGWCCSMSEMRRYLQTLFKTRSGSNTYKPKAKENG